MIDVARMLSPHPAPLPRARRRRFWMELGESRTFGRLVLTLQRDVVDGEPQRPYFRAECDGASGVLRYDHPMWVPGVAGCSLVPRAVRVRAGRRVAVLLELRAEVEGAAIEAAA